MLRQLGRMVRAKILLDFCLSQLLNLGCFTSLGCRS